MDPPLFNYLPPPASTFAPPASSFSVPVPVFPTTQQPFPPPQQQDVGELQQPISADFSSVQGYTSSNPRSTSPSHPGYHQMIIEAILALKERDGSSRQAIAKYIERVYSSNLTAAHSNLLTQHLKRMKDNGQLLMVKHSYLLPGSVPPPSPSPSPAPAFVPAPAPEVLAYVPKKSPGRPPKLKPVMNAASVQQAQFQQAPVTDTVGSGTFAVPESVFASIGLVDGLPESDPSPKRRPGRPKKVVGIADVSTDQNQNVTDGSGYVTANQPMTDVAATGTTNTPAKRGRGRPSKNGSINVGPAVTVNSPRGRGRPKQKAGVYTGKPRGRPRMNVEAPAPLDVAPLDGASAVAEGVHVGDGAVHIGRKRGRPGRSPKSAMLNQLSEKPLGRHTQNAPATTAHFSNLDQLLAYQELRGKLTFFQSRVKHAIGILKPFLESQTSSEANEALQELEELSTIDITSASSLHDMQLLPPNQV